MAAREKKASGMSVDELARQLQAVHGERLRCVLLYGSVAIGDELAQQSDHNVLVLVDAIDPDQLEKLGQTARAWAEAGNAPPLELTVEEWTRSADIFPMEYADIIERHKVLHGALPTPHVTVRREALRRQAESEAMGKVLRLRQGIMHAGNDTALQLELLRASHSTLMVIFRAALRVADKTPPRDRTQLIAETAALASFDGAPFVRVLQFLRGTTELAGKDAHDLLIGTLRGMESLTAWIDRYVVVSRE